MDFEVTGYLPYYENHISKYIHLMKSNVIKKFPSIQQYSTYYLIPRFNNFDLKVAMFRPEEEILVTNEEIQTSPFGMLFNHRNQKEFSFLFTSYNREFKSNYIDKICFFENLNLFHEDSLK